MDQFKKGGKLQNSNLYATNRLYVKNPLFKKRKKKAPGVYNPNAKFKYADGGALLTKKVTCKKCGWEWNAADGGKDITTCHKCGGEGLIHAEKGGAYYDDSRDAWISADGTVGPNGPAYLQYGGDISIPALMKKNGGSLESDLTEQEIQDLIAQGYVIEQV